MQHKSKEFIYLFLWLQIIFWMCSSNLFQTKLSKRSRGCDVTLSMRWKAAPADRAVLNISVLSPAEISSEISWNVMTLHTPWQDSLTSCCLCPSSQLNITFRGYCIWNMLVPGLLYCNSAVTYLLFPASSYMAKITHLSLMHLNWSASVFTKEHIC